MDPQPSATYDQTSPPVPSRKLPSLPVLLVLLALLASLSSTLFLAYQNMQLVQQIKKLNIIPTPTSIANPPASPTATPTKPLHADWKTYKNTAYGYSIQFPPSLKTQVLAAGSGLKEAPPGANNIEIYGLAAPSSPYPYGVITIQGLGARPSDPLNSTKSDATINGLAATRYDLPNEGSIINIIETPSKQYIQIQFTAGISDPIRNKFNEILSTFQFTDIDFRFRTYTSPKAKNLSYPAFNLNYPSSWKLEQKSAGDTDLYVVLTKGEYELSIRQAATGGAICRFGDTPPAPEGAPISDNYGDNYTELPSNISTIRYTKTSVNSYLLCMKEQTSNYFTSPTQIGGISFKTPQQTNPAIMQEIDNILKSLSTMK